MAEEENKATGSSRWSKARKKQKTCLTEQFVQLLPLYQQQAIKAALSEKNDIDDEAVNIEDTAGNVKEIPVKV